MIKIDKLIIVEGKYDKIKLKSIIDAPIIETNGYRIFKDKEKQKLIREISKRMEILIITDSDSAGFMIRNYVKNIVGDRKIYNAYIPQIKGKEKRKERYSKEGILGVEGIEEKEIIEAIEKSGAVCKEEDGKVERLTKVDFYAWGLCGKNESKKKRELLLKELKLPQYLSTNAMIDMLSLIYTKKEIENKLAEIESKTK